MNNTNKHIITSLFILIFNLLYIYVSSQETDSSFVKLYYPNGALSSEGIMINGQPEGYWKSYYKTGELFSEGNRLNGQLSGLWKFYSQKGKIKEEIVYQNDMRNGVSRKYRSDGTVVQLISFRNGVKDGIEEFFYENGTIESKYQYKDGKKEGRAFKYDQKDGRIIRLMEFRENNKVTDLPINRYDDKGIKTGFWIDFHPNENKKLEGNYVDGKKQGIFKAYDKRENLIAIYNYDQDQLASTDVDINFLNEEKLYYENGNLKEIISTNKLGLRQGYQYKYDENGDLLSAKFFQNDTLKFIGITDSLGRKQKE